MREVQIFTIFKINQLKSFQATFNHFKSELNNKNKMNKIQNSFKSEVHFNHVIVLDSTARLYETLHQDM